MGVTGHLYNGLPSYQFSACYTLPFSTLESRTGQTDDGRQRLMSPHYGGGGITLRFSEAVKSLRVRQRLGVIISIVLLMIAVVAEGRLP